MSTLTFAVASSLLLLPVEWHIDCSGWPMAEMTVVDIRISRMDGTILTTGVLSAKDATPTYVREAFLEAFESRGCIGYEVGKSIIVLTGSKKSRIRSIEFTSKGWKPAIRVVLKQQPKK